MNAQIAELQRRIDELKRELSAARRAAEPEAVTDYQLRRADGSPVRLSELFAGKPDLIVIHNMGRRCVYCTLWADGLSGLAEPLMDRAGLALCSPDEPEVLREFAASRPGGGWRLPLVSGRGSGFTADMGFERPGNQFLPGASAFHKTADGSIVRTGSAGFGPGDDFCPVWPLFDLFMGGAAGWAPKYDYAGPPSK